MLEHGNRAPAMSQRVDPAAVDIFSLVNEDSLT